MKTQSYKELIKEAVEFRLVSQSYGKPAILSFKKLDPAHQQSIIAALISDNENVRNFIESEINADLEEELDQYQRILEQNNFEEEQDFPSSVYKPHSITIANIFKEAI